MKVGIVSGGFDPLHSGHVRYFNEAAKLCDHLVVGVNSDEWLERKKGRAFMPSHERCAIIKSMKAVNSVLSFNDSDDTAIDLIKTVGNQFLVDELIFMNGGDRTSNNVPEMELDSPRLSFQFSVGGNDKANSSSWILEEWAHPKTDRPWGWYRVVDSGASWVVKELTVLPGKSLSNQRHSYRSETWTVVSGQCYVDLQSDDEQVITAMLLPEHTIKIDRHTWHRLYNASDYPVKIVEIWHGDDLRESDIERK